LATLHTRMANIIDGLPGQVPCGNALEAHNLVLS